MHSLHLSNRSAVNIPLWCLFLYARSHLKPRAELYCNLIVSPSYFLRILSTFQWEMPVKDDPTIAWHYFLGFYLCGVRKGDIWGLAWSRAKNQGLLLGWFYFIYIIIGSRQPLLVNYVWRPHSWYVQFFCSSSVSCHLVKLPESSRALEAMIMSLYCSALLPSEMDLLYSRRVLSVESSSA